MNGFAGIGGRSIESTSAGRATSPFAANMPRELSWRRFMLRLPRPGSPSPGQIVGREDENPWCEASWSGRLSCLHPRCPRLD